MATNTTNKSFPVEMLHIGNFLCLHNLDYEVKQFNIITGDMAAGKSLLIKALEFFSSIFNGLLAASYADFIENLEIDSLRKKLAKDFDRRFRLERDVLFDIKYSCSYENEKFEIILFRDEAGKEISFKSEYLEKELNEWKDYIKDKNHNDFSNIRAELYDRFSKKFNDLYPLATTFIPASRAALAVGTSKFWDYYIMEYNDFIGYIKKLPKSDYIDKIHEILKATIEINGEISLFNKNGAGKVNIARASSGQQEIFYILLLLDRLDYIHNDNYYFKLHSVYIEEPEAHLFPFEQKQVMELIVQLFNNINDLESELLPIKIFITTHSPYVLNVVNNMLLKGNMINNFPSDKDNIINDEELKKIPALMPEKVSAKFVREDGSLEDILEEYDGDHVISSDRINNISKDIMDEYNFLNNFKNKLLNDRLPSNS